MQSFFFNDTATTEIYTLSLHDALPILPTCSPFGPTSRTSGTRMRSLMRVSVVMGSPRIDVVLSDGAEDRKSTRLNSSHANISYAVFCLKKKKSTVLF